MNKRPDESNDTNYSVPAKKPKYNNEAAILGMKCRTALKNNKSEDVWGADFAEEDIQEMDFIASQVSMQDENMCTQVDIQPTQLVLQPDNHMASSSKGMFNLNSERQAKQTYDQIHMRKRMSLNASVISTFDYKEFEKKLVENKQHNSTFLIGNETDYLREVEKLRLENKKLSNDFRTKEGEVAFLRNQLQQVQLRVESMEQEKINAMREQSSRYKAEIGVISKENESLKTELEMKTLEAGNLMDRCKILECGHVKLTEPHVLSRNFNTKKNKFNISVNQQSSPLNSHRTRNFSIENVKNHRTNYILKTWIPYYPLANMSETGHDVSYRAESIISLNVINKSGRHSSPILEEKSTNVIENPEFLRPVTTMIGKKKLAIEFISADITTLQRKTDSELESEICVPIINKIIATARELLLNITCTLRVIFKPLKLENEKRDTPDLHIDVKRHIKSASDSRSRNSSECAVEARKVLGIMSSTALTSSYLSKYIAGKTQLHVYRDNAYKQYLQQMTRMEYVLRIIKEMISMRPLPCCYVLLSKTMTVFVKSTSYLQTLCINQQPEQNNSKDKRGSTLSPPVIADSCVLEIFLSQLQNYQLDLTTRLEITDSFLFLIKHLSHKDMVPSRTDDMGSCDHCTKLIRFIIRSLSKSSEINLSPLRELPKNHRNPNRNKMCCSKLICEKHSTANDLIPKNKFLCPTCRQKSNDPNYWHTVRRKQLRVLKNGLIFLSHLAIRDPDIVSQSSDIENSLHLFLQNINNFENLRLHQNEQEAMARIKQAFIMEKAVRSEYEESRIKFSKCIDVEISMEDRHILPSTTRSRKNNDNKSLRAIKALLQ